LACPALGAGRPIIPGAWVRVYAPDPQTGGRLAAGSREVAGRTPRPYTITRWDPATGTFVLDFVLHGRGPGASWAESAAVGDELPLTGPIGRFAFPDGARRVLLAGDATAFPAIRELAAVAPADALVTALVELPLSERVDWTAGAAARVRTEWLDDGGLVARALDGRLLPAGWQDDPAGLAVWLGAEARDVSLIRRALTPLGLTPGALHATGYWRAEADRGPSPTDV
jgi:NADPH-dependent ferric siderophore reductase